MKIVKYFILMPLFFSNAKAQTNWDELVKFQDKIKEENISFGKKNEIVANIVTFPNGAVRLANLLQLNTPNATPKIIFHKKGTAKDICNDFVLYGEGFEAELILDAGNTDLDEIGVDSHNNKVRLKELDNSPTIGEVNIAFDTKRSGLAIRDLGKMPDSFASIWDFYLSFLSQRINSERGQIVKVSLSALNGFACDLALGNLTINMKRKVSHEVGLPEKKAWLKVTDFLNIYQDFWKAQESIGNSNLNEIKKQQLDLIAMGMAVNGKVPLQDFAKEINRTDSLMQALLYKKDLTSLNDKTHADAYSVREHYLKTHDYVKPKDTFTKYLITVQSGPAEVFTDN